MCCGSTDTTLPCKTTTIAIPVTIDTNKMTTAPDNAAITAKDLLTVL